MAGIWSPTSALQGDAVQLSSNIYEYTSTVEPLYNGPTNFDEILLLQGGCPF